MTESQRKLLEAVGGSVADTKPKPKSDDIVRITREEYNLLEIESNDTIYYIFEDDGTVTIKKGANI